MFEFEVVDAIPALLGEQALDTVNRAIDGALEAMGPAAVAGAERQQSVHEIPGKSVAETVSIFEPEGRIELYPIPEQAEAELDRALGAYLPLFGPTARLSGWMVFEYGTGQFINSHVDYPTDPAVPETVKLVAVSVNLLAPSSGGDFFVEYLDRSTFRDDGGRVVRDLHWGVPWFREARRIRWSVEWHPGDAIVWGTEVSHGTKPVTSGRSRKAICFIEADATAEKPAAGLSPSS